jgi:putative transposase
MARLARLSIAGHPHHVVLRAARGATVFRAPEEYRHFLECLRAASQSRQLAIHAYVLMPDHVHLLATPATAAALGQAMQSLGRRYVRWFNLRHHRTGALWEGRYRSSVIEAAQYLLDCCRYIETNPVRAGLVTDAASYPWSSLRHHVGLSTDPIVSDHPIIWSLGNTPFERQSAYREVVARPLDVERVERLRWGAKGGWGVGDPGFIGELERACERPLSPRSRGRRKRVPAPDQLRAG